MIRTVRTPGKTEIVWNTGLQSRTNLILEMLVSAVMFLSHSWDNYTHRLKSTQKWGRICGKEKAAYILLSLGGGSEGFSLITRAAPNLSFPSTCLLQGLSSDNEE